MMVPFLGKFSMSRCMMIGSLRGDHNFDNFHASFTVQSLKDYSSRSSVVSGEGNGDTRIAVDVGFARG